MRVRAARTPGRRLAGYAVVVAGIVGAARGSAADVEPGSFLVAGSGSVPGSAGGDGPSVDGVLLADGFDLDGDGFCDGLICAAGASPGDCDDSDPATWPGAVEIPYDAIDQDCDGTDLLDVDGDGWRAEQAGGPDCDDQDSEVHPGVTEDGDGDGVDDDCDGDTDEDAPPEDPWACQSSAARPASPIGWLLLVVGATAAWSRLRSRRRRAWVGP